MVLDDGSRIGVVGGGPAGSFFTYFALDLAQRSGLRLEVDLFEPRDFTKCGPAGCNMCGGIVSETLVQSLAIEGVNLPPSVVQRGLDSYVLHMDVGSVRIETPLVEKRIAAVHRGAGPLGLKETRWHSLDAFLLGLVVQKGAKVLADRVSGVEWVDGRPKLQFQAKPARDYDLVVVATGVNAALLKSLEQAGFGYSPPATVKTAIREYGLAEAEVQWTLGSSMHVFLLDIPRLEFAAIIPKGTSATLCLLGDNIDRELVDAFLDDPVVKRVMPPGWSKDSFACHCFPRMNVAGAPSPFLDRMVFVGDCGVTRLYKDGIGGAYRTAKAAATTAVLHGVSADDFRRHYLPVCSRISGDNAIGKWIFRLARQIQRLGFIRRAILRMAQSEHSLTGQRRMCAILWDMFTGSAPYREILQRAMSPSFGLGFLKNLTLALFRPSERGPSGAGLGAGKRPD